MPRARGTLVVFVKEPRAGAVKTRLAAAVGDALAARLYRALVELVLAATEPGPDEYDRLVCFDPREAGPSLRRWLPDLPLRAQVGRDLGERLAAAFGRAFAEGARRVVVIGSDAPAVTRETVLEAFRALEHADVVLGPAEDGGYYLIAFGGEPRPELLVGIDWSTPRVLEQTLERAAAARLRVHQLETQPDIDTIADLRAAWPAIAPRLAAYPELLEELARCPALRA